MLYQIVEKTLKVSPAVRQFISIICCKLTQWLLAVEISIYLFLPHLKIYATHDHFKFKLWKYYEAHISISQKPHHLSTLPNTRNSSRKCSLCSVTFIWKWVVSKWYFELIYLWSTVGNLLMFSAAATFAWPSINSNELQEKNSTYSAGTLTFEEVSHVISLANIGSVIGNFLKVSKSIWKMLTLKNLVICVFFIGNFAVVPLAGGIGPKSTIHLLSIPIIVNQNSFLHCNCN